MIGSDLREGARQARIGAWRHYGRKHPFLFAFGPIIAKFVGRVLLFLAPALAIYWVGWVLIPHWVLGSIALTIAGGGLLALFGRSLLAMSTRARLNARASGRQVGPSLGWAYALLILAGVGMGWLALWSPYA